MEPTPRLLSAILLGLALAVAGIDVAWAAAAHFDVDMPAYTALAAASALLACGAAYYGHWRREPALAAMLAGTGFLCAFSAGFSVLNYFLLTIAGPRIDGLLARLDRAMGIFWPALMAFAAAHPRLTQVLELAYVSMLPQVALVVIVLGCTGRSMRIYGFCLSVAVGAAIAAAIWTAVPSFGAFSVYSLPAALNGHLHVALDQHYAQSLLLLLRDGPGRIAPDEVKGLIGFPSYHAVLALLVIWYLRDVRLLRGPVIALDLAVLLSTPVQGGHDVVDVMAGVAVAIAAVAASDRIMAYAARRATLGSSQARAEGARAVPAANA